MTTEVTITNQGPQGITVDSVQASTATNVQPVSIGSVVVEPEKSVELSVWKGVSLIIKEIE